MNKPVICHVLRARAGTIADTPGAVGLNIQLHEGKEFLFVMNREGIPALIEQLRSGFVHSEPTREGLR